MSGSSLTRRADTHSTSSVPATSCSTKRGLAHGVDVLGRLRTVAQPRPGIAQHCSAAHREPPAPGWQAGRPTRCSSRHRTAPRHRATTAPSTTVSRSANATAVPASKYSSPMLRPPTIDDLVVGGERLVVHSAIEAREAVRVVADAEGPAREGIEQPHLDVGMRIERGERRIEAARVLVVEQEADADAALRRLPQRLEHQVAGRVGVPDVVLDVEAALGRAGDDHPRRERVAAAEQRHDAGLARMCRDRAREGAAYARAACVHVSARGRAINAGGKAGAARERGDQAGDEDARGERHGVEAAFKRSGHVLVVVHRGPASRSPGQGQVCPTPRPSNAAHPQLDSNAVAPRREQRR